MQPDIIDEGTFIINLSSFTLFRRPFTTTTTNIVTKMTIPYAYRGRKKIVATRRARSMWRRLNTDRRTDFVIIKFIRRGPTSPPVLCYNLIDIPLSLFHLDPAVTRRDPSTISTRKKYLLLLHMKTLVTREQIGGPVSQIEQDKHERESDTRDEVNPGGTFRSTREPTPR